MLKASSNHLAPSDTGTPVDYAEVQRQAIHFRVIESLRRNEVLITTEPDMGVGMGVMDYKDYVYETLVILSDGDAFIRLGPCERHDRTKSIELNF